MSNGNHTKRSEEFQDTIEKDMGKLQALSTILASNYPELMDQFGEVLYRTVLHLRDNTTDSSCMVKAAHDEPVFVLRGQDTFAGDAVVDWIQRVVEGWCLKNNKTPDELAASDPKLAAKIKDAHEASAQMRAYRMKFPD